MPTPKLDFSKARELCTAGEWSLVNASSPGNIRKLSESQLRKHVEQSRKLRDKWKDQSAKQRREVQKTQKARATDKAGRSKEKSELFRAVLSRFEEQLATRFGKETVGGSAASRSSKPQRTQGHKRQRSQVKEELAQKRTASAPKTAAKPKTTAKAKTAAKSKVTAIPKTAAKSKTAKPQQAEQEATSQTPPPAKSSGAALKPSKRTSLVSAAAANEGLTPVRSKQRKANRAANLGKVEASGLTSRIRGHVSARGKRNQARRDSRN